MVSDGKDPVKGISSVYPPQDGDAPEQDPADAVQPPLDALIPAAGPEAEYPLGVLPLGMQQVIRAGAALASTPISMAATSYLASVTAAEAHTLRIKEGPKWVCPSLYHGILSESGQRKSRLHAWMFAGNDAADDAAMEAHQAAQAQYLKDAADGDGAVKGKGKQADQRLPKPTRFAPYQKMEDATLEAFLRQLDGGRRSIGLLNDEAAGEFSGGWNSQGKVLTRLLSGLSKLYDAGEFDLHRTSDGGRSYKGSGCFVMCISLQLQPGTELITHPAAATGFAPRLLACYATHRHYAPGPEMKADRLVLKTHKQVTLAIRQVFDRGLEWTADDGSLKPLIRRKVKFDPAAEAALGVYQDQSYDDPDLLAQGGAVTAFRTRRQGNARRLAAIIAAAEADTVAVLEQPGKLPVLPERIRVSEADAAAAVAIIAWHENELRRIDVEGGTDFSDAAQQVIDYMIRRAKGGATHKDEEIDANGIYGCRPGFIQRIRGRFGKDAQFRAAVLRYLLEHRHVIEAGKRLWLNPEHWSQAS